MIAGVRLDLSGMAAERDGVHVAMSRGEFLLFAALWLQAPRELHEDTAVRLVTGEPPRARASGGNRFRALRPYAERLGLEVQSRGSHRYALVDRTAA